MITSSSEQGRPVLELKSSRAGLRMVPSLGGRIIGLASLRTGREWCWRQDRPDWLWATDPGQGFGASCQAGVDECVPTVAPCRMGDREVPDHGELWYRDWPVDAQALSAGILESTLDLDVSPLRFTRSIRAREDGSFAFRYRLLNTGTRPEPWLWCIHPLLALAPGDRLELPAEVSALRLNGGLGAPMALGDVVAWPEPFPGFRLDRAELPAGACLKGFAGPLTSGRAAVANAATGDRLEWRWDPAELPFLGLWINGGHGGFRHAALEPATGGPDALAESAGTWRQARILAPGATASWSLILDIS